jgi:acyl-CoA thioester hydrolase
MSHDRKLVHTTRVPIRWGDMDAMGHVNNTVYFRYMEQTRIEWFYACAQRLGVGAYEGQGPVIVNASCTFHVPLTYPGEAEVRMFVGPLGKTSMESYYEISMAGRKYADGAAKLVWIDLKTTKSAPLPEPFRALLLAPAGA